MLSVQDALQKLLADFQPLSVETIPLVECLGRVLAEPVTAANDLPHFDNSSMDGFALRSADVTNLPRRLRVIGEIPAGTAPTLTVNEGEAARIMTGAMLPPGADLIVPIEDTDQNRATPDLPELVEIHKAGASGAYIRRQGEDVRSGETLLAAGHQLRPQDLGLLAGLGIANVNVIRLPRVAVLSTGDELLPPDIPLEPGKIRDMNSFTIPAMVAAVGAVPLYLGIAGDTADAVRNLLHQAVDQGADLILSSAGVSVGAYDVVKDVLEELGAIGFWKVNMRPGKPLAYGQVRGVPFLGLPGNPVSALASFEVFARPAILKMMGLPPQIPEIEVIVGEDMPSDGRESYIRVTLSREDGKLIARSTGTQSSGAISSLVRADALLVIPSGVTSVRAGDTLRIRPFAGQPIW